MGREYDALVLCFLFIFLLIGPPPAAAATFLSDDIFNSHYASASTTRHLLQAQQPCPVNFEFLNYTIITSQCKGPSYPPSLCCSSFKTFACPYADAIDDLTTNCASTMFSYINLYGNYPPGLFASECREGKLGLACPAPAPSPSPSPSLSSSKETSAASPRTPFTLLLMITCGVLLLFQFHLL